MSKVKFSDIGSLEVKPIDPFKLEQFFDFQKTIINNSLEKIKREKERIISMKMQELGIKKNSNEEKRRFKNFVVEYGNGEETYWYNDGSETGLRIVTFKEPELSSVLLEHKGNFITSEIQYF